MLYRDFVSDHDESGAKVSDLQLVLVERKVLGGPLVLTNVGNFVDKESCDASFTADVFDFHLAPGDEHHSGLLDHLTKLYFVGDHGPHFSANSTLLNESTFFCRYGKVVECIFLCSYHAYNRCDAAGVVPKRLAAHEKRQSKGPVGALAYAELVNSSSYANYVAFAFPAINRGVDVFPAELTKLPHARQCCDVLYHRTPRGRHCGARGGRGVVPHGDRRGAALRAARPAAAREQVHVCAVQQQHTRAGVTWMWVTVPAPPSPSTSRSSAPRSPRRPPGASRARK
jgi:hypothetical protein